MRQQIIRRLFMLGLVMTTTSAVAWAAPPVKATDEEEVTALEGPGTLQAEPPPALTPPPRPKPARPTHRAQSARTARVNGFLFFNPRNPRNLGASLTGPSSPAGAATSAAKIAWQKDFKAAHKQAIDSKKPLLLVFGAPWCQSCQKMEKEVFNRPEIVAQIQHGFVPVHLDADQNKSLTELMDVDSIPTIVILDSDLEVVKRIDGFQSARNLSAALKSGPASQDQKVRPVSLEETPELAPE